MPYFLYDHGSATFCMSIVGSTKPRIIQPSMSLNLNSIFMKMTKLCNIITLTRIIESLLVLTSEVPIYCIDKHLGHSYGNL